MIKSRAQEILGRQEVQSILDTLKKTFQPLLKKRTNTLPLVKFKSYAGLLREQVSIRNTVSILKQCAITQLLPKTDVLVEKVRQRLGRQICLQYADERKQYTF